MSDLPKRCPECGERYQWYEAECPECRVALVQMTAEEAGNPGAPAEPFAMLAEATDHSGDPAVRLEDKETHQHIGDITDEQLDFLLTHLEQESAADRDFYIDSATIDLLAERGGAPALIELLRKALAGREGMDVAWR